MKPGRKATDLLYMTYIISVLKTLSCHGIFAFFAFHMLPWMFPAPCKEHHLFPCLPRTEYGPEARWATSVPWRQLSPREAKEDTAACKASGCPRFTASTSPITSMILPRQPLLIPGPRESLFQSLLCPWDLSFKWHQQKADEAIGGAYLWFLGEQT